MASCRRPARRCRDGRRLVGSSRRDRARGATRDAASALGRAVAHRDTCVSRANTPGLWCDSRPRANRRRCGARAPAVLSASGLRRPAVLSSASVRARHRPSRPSARASRLATRAVAQPANSRGGHEHSRLPGLRSNCAYTWLATDNRLSQIGVLQRRRRGQGLEFHQLRDYRQDDSPRQIDWSATARARRLIAREYQDKRDQQIVLVLDCGQRMRARDGAMSHFDHALNALLLLAYVALRQGDAVGVGTFAHDRPRFLPPRKSIATVSALMHGLFDLQPSLQTPDYLGAATALGRRLTKRALIVIGHHRPRRGQRCAAGGRENTPSQACRGRGQSTGSGLDAGKGTPDRGPGGRARLCRCDRLSRTATTGRSRRFADPACKSSTCRRQGLPTPRQPVLGHQTCGHRVTHPSGQSEHDHHRSGKSVRGAGRQTARLLAERFASSR